jgi:hypothetical protein
MIRSSPARYCKTVFGIRQVRVLPISRFWGDFSRSMPPIGAGLRQNLPSEKIETFEEHRPTYIEALPGFFSQILQGEIS